MNVNIKNFIEQELDYFQPMLDRAKKATPKQRKAWAMETVRERHARISKEIHIKCSGKIQHGPFQGMALSANTWWSKYDLGAQCLGIYEYEILVELEVLLEGQNKTFIDIGAADGYYAVGALFSGLCGKVICFEQSEAGRDTIRDNWKANGAHGSLIVQGEANNESLSALKESDVNNAVVLIDVEGAEFDILTEPVLEKLKRCVVILEVHNWAEDFVSRYTGLLQRLHAYFDIEKIDRKTIDLYSFSELRDLTDDNRALLGSERRPCAMRFLKLLPRGGS